MSLLTLTTIILSRALAQQRDESHLSRFHSEHFTVGNGLPQNSVYSIVRDQLGFMWLSTERGLVRYDGKEFTVFDDFGDTYTSGSIRNIGIDPRPTARGLYAINNEHRFIRIYQGSAVADTSLINDLRQLPFPYPSQYKGHLLERLPKLDDIPGLTPYVAPMGQGRYFVYDQKTLRYYDNNQLKGNLAFPNKHPWGFFRLGNSLYHWENGRLTRFRASSERFKNEPAVFKGALVGNPCLNDPDAFELFWNNASNQTFIRLNQSLYYITVDENGNLDSKLILEGFNFSKDIIRAVYYDQKAERIFLGSHINGLFMLTRKKFATHAIPFPDTDQVYYGQASMGKRSILSSQGIVYEIDSVGQRVVARQIPLVTKSVTWDKTSIVVDANGDIWCKKQNRLMLISAGGLKMKASWNLPSEITQLYHGPDATIWIGTLTAGIFQMKAPLKAGDAPNRFIGPLSEVSWIQQAADFLWIGTVDGLLRVEKATGKVIRIKGLNGIYVRSLHISTDGSEVWVTTYKNGFFLLKNSKLTRFPLDRKGYLANTHCIVEDLNGFFWIPTNHGLFQVLKNDLLSYARHGSRIYYHLYSKEDGFNSDEFNGRCEPCAVRLGTGHVSLPSMDGLVWYKPETIAAEVPDRPVIINSIQVDRHIQPAGQAVSFSQNQKELRIELLTPFFGNQNNLEFSYALREKGSFPAEADWLPIEVVSGNKALITILTLGKGNYTLFVRKMNGFGRQSFSYKAIDISVPPFWYQTWWFYSLASILLIAAAAGLGRYRINRVRRVNLALEKQVNVRTAQLQTTLRDLQKSQDRIVSQMRLQSRLMASIAHDVRSPLRAVIAVAGEQQKMIDKGQHKMASSVSKDIEESIKQVKASLEEMLAYAKFRIYDHEPRTEVVNLNQLIDETMQLYGNNTRIYPNTFVNQVPLDICVTTNVPLLKIIVHNLIDNANKFTDNGVIKAYVLSQPDSLRLFIEDNGRGISQELVTWFDREDRSEKEEPPTGIGLVMVKELSAERSQKYPDRAAVPWDAPHADFL
ncbi:ATP-binding protein [Dyadobacter sp. 676]|uniref:histidine kinase n=1 Tax=Dyadobacter sp. 676 TaxID=3088362 RepID=A0AAU8FMS5_9BACT